MPELVSTTVMVTRLEGLLGTRHVNAWAEKFITDMVRRRDDGRLTSLTEAQVEKLAEVHGEHFA